MFLPYLAADVHRARLLAAELPAQGWDVELLVPGDAFQLSGHYDPSAALLAVDAPVHRAEPEWSIVFALLNSRSLGWRAYRPLRRLGDALLSRGRFDLVYFSCSQPAFFHLGVGWRHRFGTPFVLDFHDPWYSDLLPEAKHLSRWRRTITNRLSRSMESATLKHASGIISVSPKYLETLNVRYKERHWAALRLARQAVIPFGASDKDYVAASKLVLPEVGISVPGTRTIVYTGAGGSIMEESFRNICRLLTEAQKRWPLLLSGVRIHFFGTEPLAAGQAPTLTRIIAEEGLSGLIFEYPARLSYLEALRRVMDADGLLVLGIDDPAYNPSKLFLYGASGKPILACMRAGSVVDEYFDNVPELGQLVHFGGANPDAEPDGLPSMLTFLQEIARQTVLDRRSMLAEWLAPAMARRHAELFDKCSEDPSKLPDPPPLNSTAMSVL
jgi:glycosyltransferase involved in cell wall biosynthesis